MKFSPIYQTIKYDFPICIFGRFSNIQVFGPIPSLYDTSDHLAVSLGYFMADDLCIALNVSEPNMTIAVDGQ